VPKEIPRYIGDELFQTFSDREEVQRSACIEWKRAKLDRPIKWPDTLVDYPKERLC
jgi:hypothetical protein